MISIIIPALNEENAISGTIVTLQTVLSAANLSPLEIIVIDDGSTDRTAEVAELAGAKILRHPHNVGYGRSLKAGIRAAKYDTIVIIDADLTYPVDTIPQLIDEYKKGFDMVVAARTGKHYVESALKGPLRTFLKGLVEFTAGRDVPDVNSGLRVFSREAISSHLDHLCDTFSFTTSLTLAYMLTGRFVSYVPIPYNARVGQTKVRLFRDSLRTLQYILQAIVYYNPIKLFLFLSLFSVSLGAVGLIGGLLIGLDACHYLAVGGLLLSILLFAMGMLADLLRQSMISIGNDTGTVSKALYSKQPIYYPVIDVHPDPNSQAPLQAKAPIPVSAQTEVSFRS